MTYQFVLLDLDHTLFDTDTSEDLAFEHTMSTFGVDRADFPHLDLRAEYDRINKALWAAVERHELTAVEVRERRFEQFVERVGLSVDPSAMASVFVDGLASFGELYDGALEAVIALAEQTSVALVTNGLGEVQRPRVRRVGLEASLRALVISGEVLVAKPAAGIFDLTFREFGVEPSRLDRRAAVIVGDSLSSDIRGGSDYGIGTCWFNPHGTARPTGATAPRIDHELSVIAELPRLLGFDS